MKELKIEISGMKCIDVKFVIDLKGFKSIVR